MIYSMTGFGQATLTNNEVEIAVEVKSLNSRQADIKIKLPHHLRDFDYPLRKIVQQTLVRGKIDVNIDLSLKSEDIPVEVNFELLGKYANVLRQIEEKTNRPFTDFNHQLLGMPEVIKSKQKLADEALMPLVEACLQQALEKHQAFRAQEGNELYQDLLQRNEAIAQMQAEVAEMAAARRGQVHEKLQKAITEFIADEKVNKDRLEQELIYYLEKYDITEELVRLKSHCSYFNQVMEKEQEQGRKLGFITQEMGREINTIGSKANHAPMQVLVVKMKDELEKIKEQLGNVL